MDAKAQAVECSVYKQDGSPWLEKWRFIVIPSFGVSPDEMHSFLEWKLEVPAGSIRQVTVTRTSLDTTRLAPTCDGYSVFMSEDAARFDSITEGQELVIEFEKLDPVHDDLGSPEGLTFPLRMSWSVRSLNGSVLPPGLRLRNTAMTTLWSTAWIYENKLEGPQRESIKSGIPSNALLFEPTTDASASPVVSLLLDNMYTRRSILLVNLADNEHMLLWVGLCNGKRCLRGQIADLKAWNLEIYNRQSADGNKLHLILDVDQTLFMFFSMANVEDTSACDVLARKFEGFWVLQNESVPLEAPGYEAKLEVTRPGTLLAQARQQGGRGSVVIGFVELRRSLYSLFDKGLLRHFHLHLHTMRERNHGRALVQGVLEVYKKRQRVSDPDLCTIIQEAIDRLTSARLQPLSGSQSDRENASKHVQKCMSQVLDICVLRGGETAKCAAVALDNNVMAWRSKWRPHVLEINYYKTDSTPMFVQLLGSLSNQLGQQKNHMPDRLRTAIRNYLEQNNAVTVFSTVLGVSDKDQTTLKKQLAKALQHLNDNPGCAPQEVFDILVPDRRAQRQRTN